MGNAGLVLLGCVGIAASMAACGGCDDAPPPLACPGPGLTGLVSDDAGNALANARVTIAEGTRYTGTRTDAEGRFAVSDLAAGTTTSVAWRYPPD